MSSQFASAGPLTGQDQLTVRRLYQYERWSGIAAIVLGAIGVLSLVFIIGGAWNIFAGITRLKTADRIRARDQTVPAAFVSLTPYVIFGLINLFLGGVVGVLIVGVDLYVRDQILKNSRLFSALTGLGDTSGFAPNQYPEVSQQW